MTSACVFGDGQPKRSHGRAQRSHLRMGPRILGKTEGAEHIVAKSMIRPGIYVEIASVKTSGARCALKEGNVFARE